MSDSTKRFDNELFAEALHTRAFRMRLGQNEAARAMGVSASTLCRIVSHKKDPDIRSLTKMLNWLGMRFEDFLVAAIPSTEEEA